MATQPNTGPMPRAWPSMRLNLRPLLVPAVLLLVALTVALRRRTPVKRPCTAAYRAPITHSRTLLSTMRAPRREKVSLQTESGRTVAELRCQDSRARPAPWQIAIIRISTTLSRSHVRENKNSHSLVTVSPGRLRTRSLLTNSRTGLRQEAPRA